MMRGQAELLQGKKENLTRYQTLLDNVLGVLGHYEPAAPHERSQTSRAFQPAQSMVVRVIEAQETEKQRLARLMHDGPAQLLTNVILQAEICQRLLETDPQRARQELDNLKTEVNKTFQRTRMLIADLRPMMLDDLGLIPTLRRYVRMWSEETGSRPSSRRPAASTACPSCRSHRLSRRSRSIGKCRQARQCHTRTGHAAPGRRNRADHHRGRRRGI